MEAIRRWKGKNETIVHLLRYFVDMLKLDFSLWSYCIEYTVTLVQNIWMVAVPW